MSSQELHETDLYIDTERLYRVRNSMSSGYTILQVEVTLAHGSI